MRLFLLLYVLVFLSLNFMREEPVYFYLACTTFPVSLYLLLGKTKPKKKSSLATPKKEDFAISEPLNGFLSS